MLEIRDVRKTFFAGTANERVALKGVNLTLAEGDFVTVIGSNGAGKSTLLNIVAGRLSPDAGSVLIDARDVTSQKEHSRAKLIGRVSRILSRAPPQT